MLEELHIENFAIIDKLDLNLSNGLIAFTGETGAGKSILLDAILTLVGSRVDATLIRTGADRAMVEATFRVNKENKEEVHQILKREDLLDDPDYVAMSREVRREGRNVARVNGRTVNISILKEIGECLVDIHGQSAHLSLLTVRRHLDLLDRYANTEELLDSYREVYRFYRRLQEELDDLRKQQSEAERRIELLQFQVEEIQSAGLKPGDESELRQERDRLANAEHLAKEAQQSLFLLEEGSAEVPPVSELLGQVIVSLSSLVKVDASKADLFAQVEGASEALKEASNELQNYLEQIEFNPRRLDRVEERLGLIQNLKRKYGGSEEAILAHAEKAKKQLENISQVEGRITELEGEEGRLRQALLKKGQELSERRKVAAQKMAEKIERELDDLSMEEARFSVEFQPIPVRKGEEGDGFDETGLDRVEFLIAPNPGEGFKPLVKIASGGETSRLMLALKNVLAQADTVPTLIFDEIDQGIGGRVGMVVGEKLWHLGRTHQVLCVTHLPQLAAFGNSHYGVRKEVVEGRTITKVEELKDAALLKELTDMLGGATDENREAAQKTLSIARERAAALVKNKK